MTHDDDKLPEAIHAAMRDYNEPPALTRADLDQMWSAVEGRALRDPAPVSLAAHRHARRGGWRAIRAALPIAAVLVIGIAIGRYTARKATPASVTSPQVASTDSLALPEPYQSTTSRYLGQTAGLLATLPAEVRSEDANELMLVRAHDLLLTTRLLLDSPAAADPRIRTLLDDLELVLAQIVRLQTDDGRSELELIRQALEQRDVLPRLRTAVANISADD
mgnify:CR=1 FL=1